MLEKETKDVSLQKVTPMMTQWDACKKIAKNAILLFRMGDFYEAFYEDAKLIAKELDLALTQRQGIPMSGVPFHTNESYVDKLISKGHRVAIAEQMETPGQSKGILKREVVRIVSPGTIFNSSLLLENSNNFFAAFDQIGSIYGLAFLDLTTGEFRIIETENERELINETHRLYPSELLSSEKFKEKNINFFQEMEQSCSFLHSVQEEWRFDHQTAYSFLTQHFKVSTLDGFGLKGMLAGINAAGALLAYIQEELHLPIEHIYEMKTYNASEYMSLDKISQKNLELTESLQEGSSHNTLLKILDKTRTPMGGRMLRQWVNRPLLSTKEISLRQDVIHFFIRSPKIALELKAFLKEVKDLERLITKVSSGYATARDLVSLRFSMEQVPKIQALLKGCEEKTLLSSSEKLFDPNNIASLIANALVEAPPIRISDGNTFREGYSKELDEWREIRQNSKSWIANYQSLLRKETGIKTLRVGYTRVFGYYIEVSKGQAHKMPKDFHKRQTLVNTERFISPELKEYESKILSAEDKISSLENEMFTVLRKKTAQSTETVKSIAKTIAHIDCLHSLSEIAKKNNYIRPILDNESSLYIKDGRHPVIEISSLDKTFIPNDVIMDDKNRLFIITGPNMAGKSTYIRQAALIVIMAQIGSFVPASEAKIGIVDKVFTRIGASDDLSRGQSTFMVEMTETANILNNATSRSLVILDEIGRGTSTYDGISIAWAVAEYLLTAKGQIAKTLFATHYWELTKMEDLIPGAVNYNVSVKENKEDILFLHKIVKGGTDKSYGIHVARLAGLPLEAINRSQEILSLLEGNNNRKKHFSGLDKNKLMATKIKGNDNEIQLLLFEPSNKKPSPESESPIISTLEKIDVNALSPMEALIKLSELKSLINKK